MNEINTAVSEVIHAPLTRADALAAWGTFLPRVEEYAARRNHVESGHGIVSRLGAALKASAPREGRAVPPER